MTGQYIIRPGKKPPIVTRAKTGQVAECDFCFRKATTNVLSKRPWFAPWRGPKWFFVCSEHLRTRQWRHG